MSLSKTWKDEAVAFVLFSVALLFASGQFRFYRASMTEREVRIRHYEPRGWESRVVDTGFSPTVSVILLGTGSVRYSSQLMIDTGALERRDGYAPFRR